jgi:tetratricopeptide (TPR) repeat protein
MLVTDFGISRDWSGLSHGTTTGPTFGTKKYQAPEVAAGVARNSSSDIWSLGCVFLEMWSVLSGKSLDMLTDHFQNHGTCSEQYHSNINGIESWIRELCSTLSDRRYILPKQWISRMLRQARQDRYNAQVLLDMIQEASNSPECFPFVGFCCTEHDHIAESVVSSAYEPADTADLTGSVTTLRVPSIASTRASRTTRVFGHGHDLNEHGSSTPSAPSQLPRIDFGDPHSTYRPSSRTPSNNDPTGDIAETGKMPNGVRSPKMYIARNRHGNPPIGATGRAMNPPTYTNRPGPKSASHSQNEADEAERLVLHDPKKYREAEKVLREVVDGREATLGKDHEETLSSTHSLGLILYSQKRYREAEKVLREAADGREATLGKNHKDTLESTHWRGLALYSQDEDREAEKVLREAADRREVTLGKDHEETLSSTHWRGLALDSQKRYSEAEKVLRKAADGREATLGKNHKDTLESTHWRGLALHRQKRYSEAEKMFREAADGREVTLGKDHEETLSSTHSLGLALHRQKRYSEAEKMFREAADGREVTLGKDHEETLSSTHSLGLILYNQKRYREAEKVLREAADGREATLGKNHKDTLESTHWLGLAL